jgi:hypothetical protein
LSFAQWRLTETVIAADAAAGTMTGICRYQARSPSDCAARRFCLTAFRGRRMISRSSASSRKAEFIGCKKKYRKGFAPLQYSAFRGVLCMGARALPADVVPEGGYAVSVCASAAEHDQQDQNYPKTGIVARTVIEHRSSFTPPRDGMMVLTALITRGILIRLIVSRIGSLENFCCL